MNIEHKACEIIADQANVDTASIDTDTRLESLGLDSLDILEIQMACEEEFYCGQVDNDEFAALKTVGGIVEFIKAKL